MVRYSRRTGVPAEMMEDMMNGIRAAAVFDAHCDTATRLMQGEEIDIGTRLESGHVDVPRMKEGGVYAQVFACWVDPDIPRERWNSNTLKMIRRLRKAVEIAGGDIEVAENGSRIEELAGKGKIAAVIGVEGGHAIGASLGSLETLYENGVRCMTLTWNNTNDIADSCEGAPRWNGLSDFGREVIGEMNRAGMVIDCSHASDKTFFDVLETTSKPVLQSHSCMRGICDVPRNLSDDMLRALGENGGVVGINFFPAFLEPASGARIMNVWNRYKAERSRLAAEYGGDVSRADGEILDRYLGQLDDIPMPGIDAVVDHIVYAAETIGVDHVGLGSDFDGIAVTPAGLEDISRMGDVETALEKKGFSAEERARIMGGNLLRLFKTVTG